jgi:MFS family permease
VDSIGNGLLLPLGLIFFLRITHVSLAEIGVLLSAGYAAQLPVPLIAGALADRVGARPLVVLAQVLQAVGYVAGGLATGPPGILVSATLNAIGVRLFWSSIFTVISDYVDGRHGAAGGGKDHWYGWASMSRTAGLGIGGLVTGIAISSPGTGERTFRTIALGAAACFAIAGATISTFVRAPRAGQETVAALRGYLALLRDRPYLGLIAVNTCFALCTIMLPLALPAVVLIQLHAPAWLVAGLLVANTVLVSLATAPVVLRLRPFRRTRAIVAAASLWGLWALLLAILPPAPPAPPGWVIPVLIGATLLYTAATIVHTPISIGLATAAAPVDIRGRYLATFQYSFTFAEIVGPSFFTTLFAIGHRLPWLALAALNGFAIGALLLLERRLPQPALRDPPTPTPRP